MLIIRASQMEIFQPVADASFIRRTVEYLLENHGDVVIRLTEGSVTVKKINTDVLRRMVRYGISRGRQYGLSWESSLTAFVTLMFVTAPNFDEHPLIQRVLKDETVPADSRIDQLWDRTTAQNWNAAIQNYDVGAWRLENRRKRGE